MGRGLNSGPADDTVRLFPWQDGKKWDTGNQGVISTQRNITHPPVQSRGIFFSSDITRIPLPLVTLGLDAQSLTSLTITQLLWDRLLATLFPLGPDSNLRNIFSVYKSFTLEQLPSYSKLEANSTLIIIITSSAYILMEAYSQALFKN